MKTVRTVFLMACAVFLYLPILVVSASSLNGSRQMVFPPVDPGFTWYRAFFEDSAWTAALQNSLMIALVSAFLATLLATVVAYLLWRQQSRFHVLLNRALM